MKRPYKVTGPIGAKATLGLIVLQVDETIEQDFRRMFPDPDIALYVSRIPSGAELTQETIAQMERDLPRAAELLPKAACFDVVAYACTSGTTLIGAERVARLVTSNVSTRAVSNPLSSAIAALNALSAKSVALVSPYIEPVATPVKDALCAAGLSVPATLSFGEQVEERVARIDPASIFEAALEVGQKADVDAVFLSCTNLRTLGIIERLEARLGKPVISSNLALAWHMAQTAGISPQGDTPGRLFRQLSST
ncbi:aspartate/glutamate racemase family protein [Pseudoruegeria sp. SHC-113]|uniref:maleate cis-trans isomerase family protein n=1 Tax=Pseudoruegeria sp. SHC-113 TaxID=2855439 RepID=UPI0021BA49BA|nr:aspartate/glutamate racemase family protein [Pseudoruegeria sp. SHC-113]MCT8158625.1 aspartate/glutamate racemase family protein [Pseudoruegeria sp. SHC-113]